MAWAWTASALSQTRSWARSSPSCPLRTARAPRFSPLAGATSLNLDCRGLPDNDDHHNLLAAVISRVLSAHPGPCRLFAVPAHHLIRDDDDRAAAAVDAWLRSPALDNLQEIDFYGLRPPWFLRLRQPSSAALPPPPPPASAFRRFSATLRAATIGPCYISDGLAFGFPRLQQLALQQVCISDSSLHGIVSACPALEHLFLRHSYGFRRVRVNSGSLVSVGAIVDSIGLRRGSLVEVVVEDAPRLQRLLFSQRIDFGLKVSVVSAPRLHTLGSLCDFFGDSSFEFGSTTFQGFRAVSLMTVLQNVKNLAVASFHLNLDMVLDLMKCFPCLDKLYIKLSVTGSKNRWRRKHVQFIRGYDIRLKTLVFEGYRGIKSQVNFVSFFLVNARELEVMRLEVGEKCSEEFSAEQRTMLQMETRASIRARLEFYTKKCRCHRLHIEHVRDLSSIADPFECTC
ncbi:hypothetical protein EJB05_06370, partial [Eragrostis curvula]